MVIFLDSTTTASGGNMEPSCKAKAHSAAITSAAGSGNEKKRYRITPQEPTKPQEAGCFRLAGLDPNPTEVCVSKVPLPVAERARGSNNTDANMTGDCDISDDEEGGNDDDDEEAQDGEWNDWIQSIAPEDEAPQLEAYVTAKDARMRAKRAFEQALEGCLDGLTRAMTEEMLSDSVGKVYSEQGERFDAYETDIVQMIKSNHSRRTDMMAKMDQANAIWNFQFRKFRGGILNEESHEEAMGDSPSPIASASASEEPMYEEGGDPNWDEIANYEPSRKSVQHFLAAREKLRDADDALSHSMDEIHSGLKADADAIAQIAIDFYDKHENDSLVLENDIQFHLMNNCQRRELFQKGLEESAKQAQGLIANLMSRLTGKHG